MKWKIGNKYGNHIILYIYTYNFVVCIVTIILTPFKYSYVEIYNEIIDNLFFHCGSRNSSRLYTVYSFSLIEK